MAVGCEAVGCDRVGCDRDAPAVPAAPEVTAGARASLIPRVL